MQRIIDKIKNHPIFLVLAQAFFSVWALTRAFGLSTRNILVVILFVVLYKFYLHSLQLMNTTTPGIFTGTVRLSTRRLCITASVLSLFFTLFCLLAEHKNLTAGLDNLLFRLMILAAATLGLFFLFYHFLLLLLTHAATYTLKEEVRPIRRLPLIGFFACMICWLPYFLYEYPGIMTPDSINQFEQVLGMIPYSNHHPWAHTMTIKLFYSIGNLFTDNRNAALAFFTVFQMGFMSFCVAFLLDTLQKLRIKNVICLLILAFYALTPYHAVFAVTLWKDIMFSGAVLLFTTALLRLIPTASSLTARTAPLNLIYPLTIYTLSGIMICLYRSNGWYAFLFSLPFLLFTFRHYLKIMLPVHLLILTFALIIKIPVMNAYSVTQPDFVESICIPLQQVARVICEDKPLTAEEWESVHKVIDTTYIKDLYSPGFADNMKELVRAGHPEYLTDHKEEYLQLWISLGLRYPATYLQAHIDQTIGYWYPDVAYTVGDIDGIIANETGVTSTPLLRGPLVVKTKEILLKLGNIVPLYGLLTSIGTMFWILLCCIGITAMKKHYDRLIPYLPGLAVILTLFIATPVSSEFRYAYSLAYTLPLYLVLPFLQRRQD